MDITRLIACYENDGQLIGPELRAAMTIPAERQRIYKSLLGKVLHPFHPLLLAMLEQEMQFRRDLWDGIATDDGEFYEGIYRCAFLLYQIGDPGDTFVLWDAKYLNMDVGCSLGAEYFVGAGVEQTKDFLEKSSRPESVEILAYVNAWSQEPEVLAWQKSWEEERSSNILSA